MGIGISVFLMAVGAILAFAVDATTDGVNINTVGVILMVVGALGLLTTLVIFGGSNGRRSDVVVEERRL